MLLFLSTFQALSAVDGSPITAIAVKKLLLFAFFSMHNWSSSYIIMRYRGEWGT
jgi:hypothetical protein